MNRTEDALAKCPFYEKCEGREIQCESRIRRAQLVQTFRNNTEAIRFKRIFCDEYDWTECPYAEMLMEVYAKWAEENMTGNG